MVLEEATWGTAREEEFAVDDVLRFAYPPSYDFLSNNAAAVWAYIAGCEDSQ